MLMPAAVLVFLVLGALAVDSAVTFLAERELANAASAAANDAASVAVDLERYYADGNVELRQREAERVVAASLAAKGLDYLVDLRVETDVAAGAPVVTVRASARVETIFAGAVPGGPDFTEVQATAVATAEEGALP